MADYAFQECQQFQYFPVVSKSAKFQAFVVLLTKERKSKYFKLWTRTGKQTECEIGIPHTKEGMVTPEIHRMIDCKKMMMWNTDNNWNEETI